MNQKSNQMFLCKDLALKIIMDCRKVAARKSKEKKGFNSNNVIKEQTVLVAIKYAFEGENMQTQCSLLSCITDLYFHDYKFEIEVDEDGHKDRHTDYEIQ